MLGPASVSTRHGRALLTGVAILVSSLMVTTVAFAAPEGEEPSPGTTLPADGQPDGESGDPTTPGEPPTIEEGTDGAAPAPTEPSGEPPVDEPTTTETATTDTPTTEEQADGETPVDGETPLGEEPPPEPEELVAPQIALAEAPLVEAQVATQTTIAPAPVTCVVRIPVNPRSTGDHVRCLEAKLVESGYTISTPTDGRWDSTTTTAVRSFQRSRGLLVDGIAGPYTLSKLGIWGGSPPAFPCTVRIIVSPRSTGGHVRCLESRLRDLGYSVSGPNGTWDSTTTAAVRAYERSKGLPVDGIADAYTLTKLGIWAGPRAAFPCSVKIPVSPRSTGGHVRCLEWRLKELGYAISGPNGTYDSRTVAAVRAFERSNGLLYDGIADPYTLTKLGIWAGPRAAFPCSVKIPVSPRSTGGHVRCLQSRLIQLGYSLNGVTGRVDSSTTAAIRRYQSNHGLGVDGVAGPVTMSHLGIWAGPPPAEILPANSGTGKRIVYSKSRMRIWMVEANGTVSKTHQVSGNRQWNNPLPGTYSVYSKSRRTCAVDASHICWGYMVRFAYGPQGGRIGFHEIPTNLRTGARLQSISQLGQSLSAGCVRQSTPDAIYLWHWAPVGTKVVVLN